MTLASRWAIQWNECLVFSYKQHNNNNCDWQTRQHRKLNSFNHTKSINAAGLTLHSRVGATVNNDAGTCSHRMMTHRQSEIIAKVFQYCSNDL